jgi:hypothetical protein
VAWHTPFLVHIKKGEVQVRIDRALRSWLVFRPPRPQVDPIGTGIGAGVWQWGKQHSLFANRFACLFTTTVLLRMNDKTFLPPVEPGPRHSCVWT